MYRYFFQLLQVALGRIDQLSGTLTSAEWISVMRMAKCQALIGICASGIERLPSSQRPPKDLMMRWMYAACAIEQRNKWTNLKCGEITALLQEAGFQTCILKGQGMALLYPNPLRRQSGDIDVLVLPNNGRSSEITSQYVKHVVEYARSICKDAEVVYHHVHTTVTTERKEDGTVVAVMVNDNNKVDMELHYRISWFYSPFRNFRLQKWFAAQCNFIVPSPDCTYSVPTNAFNVVYILVHIYRHLFDDGIGLRQCLDYYYVLKGQEWNDDNKKTIRDTLKDLGLIRFCAALMYVLHTVFGLEEKSMIVLMDKKNGTALLDEIMLTGNFGQYNTDRLQSEGLWARFFRRRKRNLRFLLSYPEEVLFAPWWILWHRLWRLYNKYV